MKEFKNDDGFSNLVVVVQGYNGNDPEKGKTQSSNAGGVDNSGLGVLNKFQSSKTSVLIFDSSQSSSTQDDVSATVRSFNKAHSKGKVVLVGHSLGGDNLVEMVNDNNDLQVNTLITLDIADYYDDDNIPENVQNAVNYYQTKDFPGGEKIEIDNPSKTKGVNILAPNSTHRSIDNDYKFNVYNRINKIINNQ